MGAGLLDAGGGDVRSFTVREESVSFTAPAEGLVLREERALYSDSAYLLVTAERTRKIALYVQPGGFGYAARSVARAAQLKVLKRFGVRPSPFYHLLFFAVVRYQRYPLFIHISKKSFL